MSEETVVAEQEPEVQQEQAEVKQEVKEPVEVSRKGPDKNWDEAREVLKLQKLGCRRSMCLNNSV